jgi:hypothetical protein
MSTDNSAETKNLIAAAIDAAEEIHDALDGLVEKTATDPGAPFAPDALARLAALKQDDRAAFEALRAQLKKARCRVAALDDAISEEDGGGLDGRLYLDLGGGDQVLGFGRIVGARCRCPADLSRHCAPSSMFSPIRTSCWWSLGRSPSCALAALSGDRAVGRAGFGQVYFLRDPAGFA